jgi:hypothetical protein
MKYRKKPVVIEAWKVSELSYNAARNWAALPQCIKDAYDRHGQCGIVFGENPQRIFIKTLEGEMIAEQSDWVICGVNGELYPCKPDIFEKMYEKVEETA